MQDNSTQIIKSMLNDIEHKLSRSSNRVSDFNFSSNAKNINDIGFNYRDIDVKKYEPTVSYDNRPVFSSIGSATYFSDKPCQENELRKLLEREIEPYLHSIKNELRLFVDKFNKEAGDHKTLLSEIYGFKQMVSENKKMILTFQEEFQKKLFELDDSNKNYNIMLENSKILFEEFKTKLKNNEDKLNQTPQEIRLVNDRLKKLENLCTRIEDNVEKNFSQLPQEIKSVNDRMKKVESAQIKLEDNFDDTFSNISQEIKSVNDKMKKVEIAQSKLEDNFDETFSNFPQEIKIVNDKLKRLENSFKELEDNVESNMNEIPQEMKGLNDRLKKVENSSSELEEYVEKMNFNDMSIKIKGIEEKMSTLSDRINNANEEVKGEKKQQTDRLKRMLEEMERLKHDLQERTSQIEKEISKVSSSVSQSSDNMEKQIEGSNRSIMDKMRMMTEIIKNLKEKNSEYDECYKRTDTILRTLANNQKNIEENIKQVKENNTNNPNITNEIGSLYKNVETLSHNMTENIEENAKKSRKIIEKVSEIAEENKTYQQKLKDIIMAMKIIDNKFEEKIGQINQIALSNKPDIKLIDEDFKQEVVNRLIVDEKKFIEINENLVILDKNIGILSKKIELIELSLSNQSAGGIHQVTCFAYASCEVHSLRSNFIMKGKEDIRLTLEAKELSQRNYLLENENFTNITCYSKQNNVDNNINTKYERTSEKYKLNNLYLKCDPVNYINYSKNKLKNYLPKFYFSDKKAFVNIVEAYFELNHNEFKEGASNIHTNELFQIEGNESIVMQEEDEKTDSNEDYNSFLKEADFQNRNSTMKKPEEMVPKIENKDAYFK